MTATRLDLSAASYRPHPMHQQDRTWAETNCYIDLWVELLHSLGLDPVPAAACAFSADFDGDQWSFLKFPAEDLRALYGIDVDELNVWRPVVEHVRAALDQGRLLTVEVDAWWLPDTAGTSHHAEHTKTTIVPAVLDEGSKRLGYFHNAGFFELTDEDYDGIFRLGSHADPDALAPYVELIRLDRIAPSASDDLATRARAVAAAHVRRRPSDNPVRRLADSVTRDVSWLAGQDLATFHLWSFGLLRQCGATADLAADFVDWDAERGAPLAAASPQFRAVATGAKSLQFQLARVVRGRPVDVRPALDQMTDAWHRGMEIVAGHYGA
ncbi:MAG: DUF1839 family protein [Actinomycetota bacterium]